MVGRKFASAGTSRGSLQSERVGKFVRHGVWKFASPEEKYSCIILLACSSSLLSISSPARLFHHPASPARHPWFIVHALSTSSVDKHQS